MTFTRSLVFALLPLCWPSWLAAGDHPGAGIPKQLSDASYRAFTAAFPRIQVERLRTKDENAGGKRLTGAALRVCADLVGYSTAVYQLEGPDDGCFALSRFPWDGRSEAFLLRTPGIYEPNSKLLVIVQGHRIVASLEVASGMGDAGEERTVESLIADLDGDHSPDVLTRIRTTHDKGSGLTEPDTDVYTLSSWKQDHFERRALGAEDPLLAWFRK